MVGCGWWVAVGGAWGWGAVSVSVSVSVLVLVLVSVSVLVLVWWPQVRSSALCSYPAL